MFYYLVSYSVWSGPKIWDDEIIADGKDIFEALWKSQIKLNREFGKSYRILSIIQSQLFE